MLLKEIYGPGYSKHPRLADLVEINGLFKPDFLTGEQEAKAFVDGQYVKLHQSTLKKVDVIHTIAKWQWSGSLKTRASWWDRSGTSLSGAIDVVTESWWYKSLGALGIVGSIIGVIITLWHH